MASEPTIDMGAAPSNRDSSGTMFVASDRFLPLDYLRVPHRVSHRDEGEPIADGRAPQGFAWLAAGSGRGPRLYWPSPAGGRLDRELPARHDLGEIPLFTRTLPAGSLAESLPDGWRPDSGAHGSPSVWRHADGSVLLPFDPTEAIETLWSERYVDAAGGRGLTAIAHSVYYRVRPALPRNVQISMRRTYARIQNRREFPRWPIEPALHDLLRLIHGLLTEVAGTPVPWIGPWPRPSRWAVVLTHDVETTDGQARIGAVREIERELGYRSSWNFPALRYRVDESAVAALRHEGCEVGVHGAFHDGRDLESPRMIDERLPAMRAAAERWGADGFRSPATQRHWEWMPRLGFGYDTTYPDTDPYEPQAGGSCSWWPYFNGEMVELPITMPQDHTLFTILRHQDETTWLDKARVLRDRSGMALFLTHPDYIGTPEAAARYRRTLVALADDATAWRPLPREVADWWRRRAASTIDWDGEGWFVNGPAAGDATIRMDAP